MHGDHGVQHYAINSKLYSRMKKDNIYRNLQQIHFTTTQIYKNNQNLAKGYLPISLITPLKLKEILASVKETLIQANPDYDIVIKWLHLYYDMKLVTLGIDRKRNLIIQFPVFVQPYTQQPLILYQLETVPVPVIDQNTKANTYT